MVLRHLSPSDIKAMINEASCGMTPLSIALSNDEMITEQTNLRECTQVILLIENGADPSLLGCRSNPVLHYAAEQGDLALLDALLKHFNGCRYFGEAPIERKDAHGHTALHKAIGHGQLEAVRFLLDHQADMDAQDNQGITPLALAERIRTFGPTAQKIYDALRSAQLSSLSVAQRHMRELTRIIEATHLKEYKDKYADPKTVMELECQTMRRLLGQLGALRVTSGHLTASEAIYFQELLAKAFDLGKDHLAMILLEDGYLPKSEPAGTTTLLHLAAASNCHLSLQKIIECKGPECLSTPDQWGRTPLDSALLSDSQEAIRILLRNGATLGGKHPKAKWLLQQFSLQKGDTASTV